MNIIQIPEGLIPKAKELMKKYNAWLFGDPCFGACDVRTLPGFKTIHIGHSKMLEIENVKYEEFHINGDLGILESIPYEKIKSPVGLVTTVQHVRQLKDVKKRLEEKGLEVLIGSHGLRTKYNGQILGCDYTAGIKIKDKVSMFIFWGSGRFHPLGLAYYTEKDVLGVDPLFHSWEWFSPKIWEKEKWMRISKFVHSRPKDVGVVTSSKPGQYYPEMVTKIIGKLKEKGFEAYGIVMDEIKPERLDYMPFDAYIIVACPRIVWDDWKRYEKPVLLWEDFLAIKTL